MSSSAAPQAAPAPMREVLANPKFRRLWLAQLVSIFGDFIAIFAVNNMISFKLHGTADQVTMVMVSFMAPLALVGPIAGVLVDRWQPKRTMVASDLIRAVLVLLLVWATDLWQIYAIFFTMSVVSSFFIPAQSVTTPLIVPREALLGASALMQQAVQVVRIFSPLAAAALVSLAGERLCYYIDAASFLFSAAMIGSLAIPERPPHPTKGITSVASEMGSGFRFILSHPAVSFVILSMTAGLFAITSFGAITPLFVRDILHQETKVYGLLGSMVGIGTIAGALFVTKAGKFLSRPGMVAAGIFAIGIFVVILALLPTTPMAMICFLAIGGSSAFIIVPSGALLQEETPTEMRGRVSSTSVSLVALAQGVALIFAGVIAAQLGIIRLYYLSAAMLFVIGFTGYLRLRKPQ